MSEKFNRPISREDLLFTVEVALRKASKLWAKKHLPGDHDRLKPVASVVVEHIESCGMKRYGKALGRRRNTPEPWGGVLPKKGRTGLRRFAIPVREGRFGARIFAAWRRGGGLHRRWSRPRRCGT